MLRLAKRLALTGLGRIGNVSPLLGEYANNMADSEDQSQPAGERLIYDLNAAPDPASGSDDLSATCWWPNPAARRR